MSRRKQPRPSRHLDRPGQHWPQPGPGNGSEDPDEEVGSRRSAFACSPEPHPGPGDAQLTSSGCHTFADDGRQPSPTGLLAAANCRRPPLEALRAAGAAAARLAAAGGLASGGDAPSSQPLQELAVLQSALYTLRHQQVLQMSLIQQLQAQLQVSRLAETGCQADEAQEEASRSEAVSAADVPPPSGDRPPLPSTTPQKTVTSSHDSPRTSGALPASSPAPPPPAADDAATEAGSSASSLAAPAESPESSAVSAPSLVSCVIPPHGDGPPADGSALRLLQRTTQQVLDNASQGLLANNLVDAMYQRGEAAAASSGARREEPLFKHRCRYCGKVFGSDSALQIHVRSHTGERPYKCNICGNRFTTKGNLKVHFQRHSARFPHVQMNAELVPEHLDRLHPPLLAQLGELPEAPPPGPVGALGGPPLGPPPLYSRALHEEATPSRPRPERRHRSGRQRRRRPGHAPPAAGWPPASGTEPPAGRLAELGQLRRALPLTLKRPSERQLSGTGRKRWREWEDAPRLKQEPEEEAQEGEEGGICRPSDSAGVGREAGGPEPGPDHEPEDTRPTPSSPEQQQGQAESVQRSLHTGTIGQRLPPSLLAHLPPTPAAEALPPFLSASLGPLLRLKSDVDPCKDPSLYASLLPRPGLNDSAWEALIEVEETSETSKLQRLVDNIETKITDPNQCVVCQRVLSCKSALQMHYRTHTGERPFKCRICGRAFTTKGNLKTHMGVHRCRMASLDGRRQCPVCGRRFHGPLALQQHLRLHAAETSRPAAAAEPACRRPPEPGSASHSGGRSPELSGDDSLEPRSPGAAGWTPGSAGSAGSAGSPGSAGVSPPPPPLDLTACSAAAAAAGFLRLPGLQPAGTGTRPELARHHLPGLCLPGFFLSMPSGCPSRPIYQGALLSASPLSQGFQQEAQTDANSVCVKAAGLDDSRHRAAYECDTSRKAGDISFFRGTSMRNTLSPERR